MRKILFATTALASVMTFANAALAQTAPGNSNAQQAVKGNTEQIEEVIVTAERHTANLQKTAASVTVRTGGELALQGKYSVANILEDVPGISAGGGATDNPGTGVVVRGVLPDLTPAGDSAVATTAMYTDGVYQGIGGDYEISRVEVLRGPQGTLYGRSATGGVVSTYTKDPTPGEFAADITGEYGSFNLSRLVGSVNIPLGDTAAVLVSGQEFERNGYDWSIVPTALKDGAKEAGKDHLAEGRIKFLWQPTEDLSVLIGYAKSIEHGHSGGLSTNLYVSNTVPADTPNQWEFASVPVSATVQT